MLLALLLLTASGSEPVSAPLAARTERRGGVHPSRLFVEPAPGAAAAALARVHERLGARVIRELPEIGWQIVEVAPSDLSAARDRYRHEPLVARAEFDPARRLTYVPNDPYWPGMWSLQHLHCESAWDTTLGSSAVRVAVIDTGLEIAHPDIAASVWSNPAEIAGNGLDDDGNGYIDDVRGWDFVNDDPVPDDVWGHGTSCAGIIAATQDNALGVTGIAPLCSIVPLKACNDSGYLYDSYVVPALLYAAHSGCKVISMSFFGDQVTPAERAAIDVCWSLGCLPIAAAGNDSQCFPYYPAAYANSLAVGAHDASNQKSWFSNWGTWVGVAAPGEGISTIAPGGTYTTGFAGTSAATPHVAGIAALLFSAVPLATNAAVRAAIEDSAIALDQPPIGAWASYGHVDARAAIDRLLGITSGSKPPRLLFASPVGGGLASMPTSETSARPELVLFGVGLEAPNLVRVLRDGVPLPILSQSRHEVHARLRSNFDAEIALEVNSAVVQSFRWDGGSGYLFAASDVNTRDPAVCTGGFRELCRDDGQVVTCTADAGNARILAQIAIRSVRCASVHAIQLETTRAYANCAGSIESIEAYDWQTASYPYGSFVTLASTAVTGSAAERLVIPLPASPARFLDDEGTAYFRVTVNAVPGSALLALDSFRLRVR